MRRSNLGFENVGEIDSWEVTRLIIQMECIGGGLIMFHGAFEAVPAHIMEVFKDSLFYGCISAFF